MFKLFTTVLMAVAVASVAVDATPVARSTCTPNAQGLGVSIVSVANIDGKWGVPSTPVNNEVLVGHSFRGLAAPDFHVQQNGQVSTSFTIRDVDNDNLAVTAQGNELVFSAASTTGNQENQLFNIACQTCGTATTSGTTAGTSCTISPAGSNDACVQLGATADSPLSVVTCNGSASQLFNLVA